MACVSVQATTVEIKKAYRKLSQTYHPDVNSEAGAQDRFIQISSAYSVLGDEDERCVCVCVCAYVSKCACVCMEIHIDVYNLKEFIHIRRVGSRWYN